MKYDERKCATKHTKLYHFSKKLPTFGMPTCSRDEDQWFHIKTTFFLYVGAVNNN